MLQKLKILYIVTQGELGGAQRYVFDLARNLDKSAYDVTVAVGMEKPELQMLLQQHGIKVKTVRHLRRNIHPLEDLLASRELYELLKEIRPDIFHLNSSKAGVLGSFAAGLLGFKRVVFTAHGFAFLEPGSWPRRQVYFWAEKLATLFRQKVITVSEFDRQAAVKAGLAKSDKLTTIHNGLGTGKLLSRDEARQLLSRTTNYRLLTSDLVIGSIAHNYPTKDLATLEEAVTIARRTFPNLQLLVIGEGASIGSLPEASQYLPAFDIYCSSSVKEGFPYTILEGMRAGLPIVATAVGGVPEAITSGREGLLVRPREPQALAEAILRLLQNPELAATLGKNAREKVKQFSLQRMLQKTAEVYREVMDRARP